MGSISERETIDYRGLGDVCNKFCYITTAGLSLTSESFSLHGLMKPDGYALPAVMKEDHVTFLCVLTEGLRRVYKHPVTLR